MSALAFAPGGYVRHGRRMALCEIWDTSFLDLFESK